MVLILIFAEVWGCMGGSRLSFLSLLLNVSPQIDRGINYEHEGDRAGVLMVAFSTLNSPLLSIACNCPTIFMVYHRSSIDPS